MGQTDKGQSVSKRTWLVAVCPRCGLAQLVADGEWEAHDSVHFLPDACEGAGGDPELVEVVER